MEKVIKINWRTVVMLLSCIVVMSACKDDKDEVLAELKLDKTTIEVTEDATVTVAVVTGNGDYQVSSASADIATATVSSSTITIKGVKEGNTTITVKDVNGKTASITVNVVSKYTAPTSAQFVWNGTTIALDAVNNWGLTIYTNRLALTNLIDKQQYILSWTGDLSKGDKTYGKLQVVGSGDPISLNLLRVVKSESNAYYLVFEGNSKSGSIYFTK